MRGRYEVHSPKPDRREILRKGGIVVREDEALVRKVISEKEAEK